MIMTLIRYLFEVERCDFYKSLLLNLNRLYFYSFSDVPQSSAIQNETNLIEPCEIILKYLQKGLFAANIVKTQSEYIQFDFIGFKLCGLLK
jgi:hypothetical protein